MVSKDRDYDMASSVETPENDFLCSWMADANAKLRSTED